MAKKKTDAPKRMSKESTERTLPVCTAFLFCERAILGNDNVISAIRIVDTFTVRPDPSHKIGKGMEISDVQVVLVLKGGGASGQCKISLLCTGPTGKTEPVGTADVTMTGSPETGSNIVSPLRLSWAGAGVYWYELQVNDILIARSPFRIIEGEAPKIGDAKK